MTLCWQTTAWAVLNMVVVSTVITVASPICAPLRPDERCDRSLDASQRISRILYIRSYGELPTAVRRATPVTSLRHTATRI